MHFPLLLLLSSLWSSPAHADSQVGDEFCFRAVQYSLKNLIFLDTAVGAPKPVRPCTSRLRTASLYLSLQQYCTPESRAPGLREYQAGCLERANVSLPAFEDVVSQYGPEDVRSLRRVQPDEVTRKALELEEVALPSQVLWRRALDTLSIAQFEHDIHITYGHAMYYFWASVVAIGMLFRLSALFKGIRKQGGWKLIPDSEDGSSEDFPRKVKPGILSLPGTYLKRYITTPATFGYRCSQNIGWCTLPPRIQSLTVVVFIIINIVLCSVDYYAFPGNLYWPEVSTQLWRYFSDRTGVIAFANFPLVWLFGIRNNLLMNILGWGFGTMNSFHRWVARVATIEAIAHSIGYTVLVFRDGGWNDFMMYWTIPWWQWGELATIAMVMICVFSVYGLRRSFYELFLFLHITISVAVLVGMWYHISIFDGEYNAYIWPCVCIWLADRLLRGARILAFNPKFWCTRARTTYDSSSNIIRISIPCSSSLIAPIPGAYYYLTFLDGVRIWENHPFTLSYSTDPSHQHSDTDMATATPAEPPSLVFLIRPYKGLTARLRAAALSSPYKYNPPVLVEGPYGAPVPLRTFRHVLFLAGGTGVATPLSYLASLLLEEDDDAHTHPHPLPRRVHVVWAVRERAFLAEVLDIDLRSRGLLVSEQMRLTAFVTGDGTKDDAAADVADEALGVGVGAAEGEAAIAVHAGRPDVDAVVKQAAEEAAGQGLAVVACGPAAMADEARRAVVRVLGREMVGVGVEYFEESFKW
ncbi:uncharacterized protein K452DRAFT_328466 [Aplosporella prunicola CBS 121167]|uniref:FAD-binding FR-type domain-containing protein n=1 Tax=Aplosporella prunicola CBS 121167 TaxID=1176127 RepID=A0A6A6B7G9_9PEZI|nr:uncharacterized protein K452DRAFT_328466 [Aplosporella prunicola CBS 121167]KAF2139154.1 hypothetical protein K452DRAFT_328466 [Aplosporella prunicola CBS 121167]